MSERPSTTLVLDVLPFQGGGACPPTNPPSHAGVRQRSVEASRSQRGREKRVMTLQNDGYTFVLSNEVARTPVRYRNRYGIEIAADLYQRTGLDESATHP